MAAFLPEEHQNNPLYNPALREKAYQELYESRLVWFKVKEWTETCRLQGMSTEDVLQEAMILLDDALVKGNFRKECTLRTFFLSICFNIVRAGVRKKYNGFRFKDTFTDADFSDPVGVGDLLEMEQSAQADQDRQESLLDKMQALSAICKEALEKYYLENMNMKQLALLRLRAERPTDDISPEELQNAANYAKKTVHRCREALRKLLDS